MASRSPRKRVNPKLAAQTRVGSATFLGGFHEKAHTDFLGIDRACVRTRGGLTEFASKCTAEPSRHSGRAFSTQSTAVATAKPDLTLAAAGPDLALGTSPQCTIRAGRGRTNLHRNHREAGGQVRSPRHGDGKNLRYRSSGHRWAARRQESPGNWHAGPGRQDHPYWSLGMADIKRGADSFGPFFPSPVGSLFRLARGGS